MQPKQRVPATDDHALTAEMMNSGLFSGCPRWVRDVPVVHIFTFFSPGMIVTWMPTHLVHAGCVEINLRVLQRGSRVNQLGRSRSNRGAPKNLFRDVQLLRNGFLYSVSPPHDCARCACCCGHATPSVKHTLGVTSQRARQATNPGLSS